MVTIPPLVGMMNGSPVNGKAVSAQWLLLILWLVGYFFFYAATVWLRSHMKKRYAPPVQCYGLMVAALGASLLFFAPYMWHWAVLYLPLVAIAAWSAWQRKERSLASGFDTVAAACLLIPMMYDVATDGSTGFAPPRTIWIMTTFYFAYFAGTVLYVKTNIRERGSVAYLASSITWHAAWTCAAFLGAFLGNLGISWCHAVVWGLITVRAAWVPLYARRRGTPIRASLIGAGEIVTCAFFALTLH